MATYRNKKTGATSTTDLIISGGDWEIEEKKKKEPKKNDNKDVPPKDGELMSNDTICNNR